MLGAMMCYPRTSWVREQDYRAFADLMDDQLLLMSFQVRRDSRNFGLEITYGEAIKVSCIQNRKALSLEAEGREAIFLQAHRHLVVGRKRKMPLSLLPKTHIFKVGSKRRLSVSSQRPSQCKFSLLVFPLGCFVFRRGFEKFGATCVPPTFVTFA